MKITTQRDMIRTLPSRYAHAFERTPAWYREDWGRGNGGSGKMVHDRLLRLDLETCTVQDIHNVAYYLIGWLKVRCGACRKDVDSFVTVGADPYGEEDYDTMDICEDCAKTLGGLFGGAS